MFALICTLLYAEDSPVRLRQRVPTRNTFNMRMGASSATTNGQPTICIENTPTQSISLEACGTGYGFIHHVAGTDFVHFRGKWNLVHHKHESSLFRGQLGFGFAEIQLGDDELGFQFTGSNNGIETERHEDDLHATAHTPQSGAVRS